MEFNLSTDIKQSIPNAIVFNFEELKAELSEKIKPYETLAVTEDDLKSAKSDKATLNKLKKALNDKKVEVKKEYISPLENFEKQVKELVEIIDKGVNNIDTQVKDFEKKEVDEKLKEIASFYVEEFPDYYEVLKLEKVIPNKWQNKTCKLETIKQEIRDKVFKFENDIKVIKAMKLECEEQMLDAYIETLDMSAALQKKHEFEERQNALKLMKNSEPAKEKIASTAETVQEQSPQPPKQAVNQQSTKTIDVRFYDTTEEFRKAMKALTTQYNIRYGNVPKGE